MRVHGTPVPQGSKKAFVNPKTGRAIIVETAGARHKAWRVAVKEAAIAYADEVGRFDEPVQVWLDFHFYPPKSDPFRVRHSVQPDLDKLVRACLDALTDSGLIRDDSQVYWIATKKVYDQDFQGVEISVRGRGADEREDRETMKLAARRSPRT